MKPPSVTKVVRGLERAGIVERLADPVDGRIARVYLTAEGRRLMPAVRCAWQEAEREVLGRLSRREREMLGRLLRCALGTRWRSGRSASAGTAGACAAPPSTP